MHIDKSRIKFNKDCNHCPHSFSNLINFSPDAQSTLTDNTGRSGPAVCAHALMAETITPGRLTWSSISAWISYAWIINERLTLGTNVTGRTGACITTAVCSCIAYSTILTWVGCAWLRWDYWLEGNKIWNWVEQCCIASGRNRKVVQKISQPNKLFSWESLIYISEVLLLDILVISEIQVMLTCCISNINNDFSRSRHRVNPTVWTCIMQGLK